MPSRTVKAFFGRILKCCMIQCYSSKIYPKTPWETLYVYVVLDWWTFFLTFINQVKLLLKKRTTCIIHTETRCWYCSNRKILVKLLNRLLYSLWLNCSLHVWDFVIAFPPCRWCSVISRNTENLSFLPALTSGQRLQVYKFDQLSLCFGSWYLARAS